MSSENDNQSDPNKQGGGRNSTVHSLFFWLVIIVGIPLMIMYFRVPEQSTAMTQAKFERALLERRIDKLEIVIDAGSSHVRINGDYRPQENASQQAFQTEVILTDTLMEMVRENCEDFKAVHKSGLLGAFLMNVIPFIIIVGIIYFFFARQLKGAGKGALQFGKSRARLNQSLEKITFRDVAGIDEAKEEVEEIIDYLRDPQRFHRLGGRIPRGVLLAGPPGTGKTLLARAIAGEADVPFFNISGSDFVEMFVGVGASRVRDMFEQGKKNSPCIIFIDEIDAVGRSRFSGMGGGHDEREQTLNALLVEMDGFEGNSGVIVMAATNRPDVLDKALLRPGRFDRQIIIDLPDLNGREEILKVHSKKVKMSDQVNFHRVARGTPGFSGADLANLINEAALRAARSGKSQIEMADMEEARDKVRFGKERRSRVITPKQRKITAYHEAGHALCSIHTENSTPLHKVTIIPRGNSLGSTMFLREDDLLNYSKSELLDEIVVLMGGRYAEDIILGEITSGAVMDISQASDIARRMVCQWGMSEAMGPLAYGTREQPVFVGRGSSHTDHHSEDTARELDVEIRKIIDTGANRARQILTDNREQLEKLGQALLDRETLSAEDIYKLLDMDKQTTDPMSDRWTEDTDSNDKQPPAATATASDSKPDSTDPEAGLAGGDPTPIGV